MGCCANPREHVRILCQAWTVMQPDSLTSKESLQKISNQRIPPKAQSQVEKLPLAALNVFRKISFLLCNKPMAIPELARKYLTLLKDYTPADIRTTLFHSVLETQRDGVIEFYEFIEVMLLAEEHEGKSLTEFAGIVKEIRTGVVCDPTSADFGKNTKLQVPRLSDARRNEFKAAFKFLDAQEETDGVITEEDFLKAMETYIW